MPWESQSRVSCSVASGATPIGSASRLEGRVERANASACSVGRWTLDTSTTAWLRDGEIGPVSASTASSALTAS